MLHKPPQILHRNIRWPNIIRHLDDPGVWFLIDWDNAAVPLGPTTACTHFNRHTHSPRVFEDGHGYEVDIWGVGELITLRYDITMSAELREIGEWMKREPAPAASNVLERIKLYRCKPTLLETTS